MHVIVHEKQKKSLLTPSTVRLLHTCLGVSSFCVNIVYYYNKPVQADEKSAGGKLRKNRWRLGKKPLVAVSGPNRRLMAAADGSMKK